MGVINHIDLIGDAHCITVVGENIRREVDNIERVETAKTQLEMIHERLGGEVSVNVLGITELADPCVLDRFNDEGSTSVFGGFVQL